MPAAFANAEVISVLASRKDRVLQLAYPVGDPIADLLNLHQSPFRTALGRKGPPEPIGATAPPWQIPDADDYDHGDYLPPSAASHRSPIRKEMGEDIRLHARGLRRQRRPTWPILG